MRMHGRKPIALLAFLVTTAPRIHPRAELATLFQPELSIKNAQNNLRLTLARSCRSPSR
jgi:hypothetical protein